jgi:hypothetical protein
MKCKTEVSQYKGAIVPKLLRVDELEENVLYKRLGTDCLYYVPQVRWLMGRACDCKMIMRIGPTGSFPGMMVTMLHEAGYFNGLPDFVEAGNVDVSVRFTQEVWDD